jgi:hypothetical protein
MRLAGAALVDEDDVPVPQDGAEYLAYLGGHLRRALARTSGQKEKRIGFRLGCQRRQRDDVQPDTASGARGAILVDL